MLISLGLTQIRLSEEPSSVVVADSGTSKEQERASSVTDLDEEAAWLERVTTAEKLLADATTHPISEFRIGGFCSLLKPSLSAPERVRFLWRKTGGNEQRNAPTSPYPDHSSERDAPGLKWRLEDARLPIP